MFPNNCHCSRAKKVKLFKTSIQLKEVMRCTHKDKGTEDEEARKEVGKMHQRYKFHSG